MILCLCFSMKVVVFPVGGSHEVNIVQVIRLKIQCAFC